MTYKTPVRDILFSLEHMSDFGQVMDTGAFEDLSFDFTESVLEEAGKIAEEEFAPLNWAGNQHGVKLSDGNVTVTPGFAEAYQQFVDGQWGGIEFDPDFGGQGMPSTLALAMYEALYSANPSLSLCMLLTSGAVKALSAFGTDDQKATYLPKLVTGEWTGTMNLTEPAAGSDLSAIRTKAEPVGNGQYKISGSKIYISWGDHEMVDNICHLVLARLPDAPEGTRGISMFLVPKFHVNEDGSLGARNDAWCTGIEEKMGQHGAPTCSMAFGENGECLGTLVGKENEGLKNMFVMMNAARIDVGMQGVAMSERSYQQALAFAQERRQGRALGVKSGDMVPIIEHPDVRRNLYTMKALIAAGRAMCYATMGANDVAKNASDEDTRRLAKEREELLTPLAKSFGSDRGNEATSLGVQIHGGMGFVEETGAAQHMRDVRICTIYEGTNGIQAIDLVGRKLGMGEGKLAKDFMADIDALTAAIGSDANDDLSAISGRLSAAKQDLVETTDWMIAAMRGNSPEDGLAGATPYLDQFGYVAGAYYLAKGAKAAATMLAKGEGDENYLKARIAIAKFYADNILPRADGLKAAVTLGAETVAPIDPVLLTG